MAIVLGLYDICIKLNMAVCDYIIHKSTGGKKSGRLSMLAPLMIVLTSLLLLSCSAHQTVTDSQYQIASDTDKALIVFSFSQSGITDIPFVFHYRKVGSSRLLTSQLALSNDIIWETPPLGQRVGQTGDYQGQLLAVELPVGEYLISHLTIDDDYLQAQWTSGGNYQIPFTAKSGVINYIGNFYVQSENRDNDLLAITSHTYRRDLSKRDIKVFRANFTNMKSIEVKPTDFSALTKQYWAGQHYGQEKSPPIDILP